MGHFPAHILVLDGKHELVREPPTELLRGEKRVGHAILLAEQLVRANFAPFVSDICPTCVGREKIGLF